ncbi:MAG: tetratricopeptide repeat protein [Blastocatellia bacterium]
MWLSRAFLCCFILLLTPAFCFAQPKSKPTSAPTSAALERQLQQAVRRAPHDFDAHHKLGEFYLRAGKLPAAIVWLEKARALNPSHYTNGYDLALAYVQTGKLTAARQQIQQLLTRQNTAELHNLMGLVEETAGNQLAAAEAYQRAAQLDPNEKNVFDLGNILLQLTAANEALTIFQYGVNKHPQSSQLRVGRGIAEYTLGKYHEAVETLCQAVDLAPNDPRPYVFLGEMYGVSVELADEINQRFAKLTQTQPRNALAHYYYAMNLWKGKRSAQADADPAQLESLLKNAITLDPNLADGFYQLGTLYFEQKNYPAAVTPLRRATQLKPNDAQFHFKLAQAYQQTKQTALAAAEFALTKKLKDEAMQAEIKPKP